MLSCCQNPKASTEINNTKHISTLGDQRNIVFTRHSACAVIAQFLFGFICLDRSADLGYQMHRENLLTICS